MRSFLVAILITAFGFQSYKSHKSSELVEILKEAAKNQNNNVRSLNYKFDLPDDWQRLDTIIQGVYVCGLINNDSTCMPRISVFSNFMLGESHNGYFDRVKKSFAKIKTDFEVLEEGQFISSGNDCLWFRYNNSNTPNKLIMETLFYSIEVDGFSYTITAACYLGGLKKHRHEIDKIVKSFRVSQ